MMIKEKVLVVKDMQPLNLYKGDVLVVSEEGDDFELEQTFEDFGDGYSRVFSHFVSVDYSMVSENIPEYFDLFVEDESPKPIGPRSIREIEDRIDYFQECINKHMVAPDRDFVNDEPLVVWNNLIWNLEWVLGYRDLLFNPTYF